MTPAHRRSPLRVPAHGRRGAFGCGAASGRRVHGVVGLVALCILAAACGQDRRAETVALDLLEALPRARVRPETQRIDLGTLESWASAVHGFEERWEPVDVLRTTGREAAIRVEVAAPRDTLLTFRARARAPGITPVVVRVNDLEVGELPLHDRYDEHALEVAAPVWEEGDNRIDLMVPEPIPVPELIDWDWVRLEREAEFDATPAAIRPDASREPTLEIPFGTRLDYALRLPDAARLEVGSLRASGTRGALEVRVSVDAVGGGSRDVLVERFEAGAADRVVSLALPDPGTGIARLSLQGVPGGEVAPGSLLLRDARVVSPLAASSDSPASAPAAVAPRQATPRDPPSIIVFLIDTLRADRLGAYGYGRPTSPRIDRFAAERAVLFEAATAHSSWTKPTVASVFTGLHPSSHGVIDRETMLVDDAETMAEMFTAAGYEAAGFVTITTVASIFGFDQGFDPYVEMLEDSTIRVHQPAGAVVDAALSWVDDRRHPERPFLLYVHVSDPHTPYVPPDEWRARFAPGVDPMDPASFVGDLSGWEPGPEQEVERFRSTASDLYDAEVAYVDEQFGRFLDGLEERRLLEGSAVVLLSDHGEEFYEHGGWTHGFTLYQEQLHVPLIVRLPGEFGAGRRVASRVRQVDLLPTLLELAGEPVPSSLQGRSLLPLVAGAGVSRRARSQLRLGDREQDALLDGRWKLIVRTDEGFEREARLFDLDADPAELRDLYRRRPVTVGYMRSWLEETARRFSAVAIAAEDMDLPEDVEARLRALGYIR